MKSIDFLKNNGVDLNKCLELFGDVETYNETLKGFNKSVDGKLAQIDNFLNEGDMPNYAIFVHSLKSDCKYFGFMKLANIAFEHEMASKNNDTKFVKEHYQTLLDETEKVKSYKVVVLVNKSTASSAEILAAALKDSYGADIVGNQTYGKGSVQTVKYYEDTAIKYTSAIWLRPNGESVDGVGITPDYDVSNVIKNNALEDKQFDKALQLFN